MTEAFDTTGAKFSPLIDNTGKNHKGDGPMQSIWTSKELAEIKALDAKRIQRELDAPYIGWPKPAPPTKRQLLIREIAREIIHYASSVKSGDDL